MSPDVSFSGDLRPEKRAKPPTDEPHATGPEVKNHVQPKCPLIDPDATLPAALREIEQDVDEYIEEVRAKRDAEPAKVAAKTRPLEAEYVPPSGRLAKLIEHFTDLRFTLPKEQHRFTDQQRFKRQSEPFHLPHLSPEFPPLVVFSGIASTAYDWKKWFVALHRLTGIGGTAYSLEGHTGTFDDLRSTTKEDMIAKGERALLREYERYGIAPVLVGHSTGADVLLLAGHRYFKREGEQIVSGNILSAPPFRLRNLVHRVGLGFLDRKERANPDLNMWDHLCMRTRFEELLRRDRREIRSPSVTHLPARALLQLWRMMPEARVALAEVQVPTLIVQGTEDGLVDWKATRSLIRKSGNPHLDLMLIQGGEHTCMRGKHGETFSGITTSWLELRKESLRRNGRQVLLQTIASNLHEVIDALKMSVEGSPVADNLTIGDIRRLMQRDPDRGVAM